MLGINKTYNENCLDTMLSMDDEFLDLVVTSPPYDGLRKYNGFSFPFEMIAKELFRVLRWGGCIVWVVSDATVKGSETGTSFKQALYFMQCGFNLHDTMIYAKENYAPKNHRRYEQSFEYVFIFSKSSPKTFNPILVPCKTAKKEHNWSRKGSNIKEGTFRRRDESIIVKDYKIRDNIWTYSCGGIRTGHPAPFPEKLCEDHILTWSNENDLIYDPFMGSGTTAKMAILNNRNFIGSEISLDYCNIIDKRLIALL